MVAQADLNRIETVLAWAAQTPDAVKFMPGSVAWDALITFRALRPLLAFALGVSHEASEVVDL